MILPDISKKKIKDIISCKKAAAKTAAKYYRYNVMKEFKI